MDEENELQGKRFDKPTVNMYNSRVMKKGLLIIAAAFCVFFLFSCATVPPAEESPTVEPQEEPVAPPAEPEVSPVQPEPSEEEETFTVTTEVYEKTFQDIEGLIQDLNKLIQENDYTTWRTYLSDAYVEKYSDQDALKELSEQPLLKKYNITLRTLQDYFQYVVAPSRANARLDDIFFEDETNIKAIMLINGQRTILYQLVYIDDRWKIGI
ncbi:MAG: hypothetical protein JW760_02710 [Spirochaetales bacterium]|nr:hypothetical protein [Spirochaetales bacterium]